MKGILNGLHNSLHNINFSIRRLFSQEGLIVLNNDIRKAPLNILDLVLFRTILMDWEDT